MIFAFNTKVPFSSCGTLFLHFLFFPRVMTEDRGLMSNWPTWSVSFINIRDRAS